MRQFGAGDQEVGPSGCILPTTILTDRFVDWYTIHYAPYPTPMASGPWYTNAIHDANSKFGAGAMKIVELYLTLVVARLGAKLTGRLAAWLGDRSVRRMTANTPVVIHR
jgi:hypothetical protein